MGLPATVSDMLGGRPILRSAVDSPDAMIDLLREGLPIPAMDRTAQTLGLSAEETSLALGIPPRTLARRRKDKYLKPHESDRLYRLALLAAHALHVFDDEEQAAGWFHDAIPALGGQTPVSLLDTEAGIRLVDAELGRIEHGIFA